MTTLRSQINNAQTPKDLQTIIDNIPNQDNGHLTQLQRELDNAFWYSDLETLQDLKDFMLKRLPDTE